MTTYPTGRPRTVARLLLLTPRLLVAFVVVTLLVTPVGHYLPAPFSVTSPLVARAQANPAWMTPDQAAALDVGIPALAPSYVPEPFADYAPAINTANGYYRLYWQVPGGTPTFLQITGTLGGQIPAGSPYDLNNQLVVNSAVRGYDAYHDATPVYDSVWWAEGSVVYSVQSRGLPTDAVSFANALMAVTPQAPAATAPRITSPDTLPAGSAGNVSVSGAGSVTVTADAGAFSDTGAASIQLSGDATVSWVAPATSSDLTVTFSIVDASGTVLNSTQTLVTGNAPATTFGLACPGTVAANDEVPISVSGSGTVTVYASSGAWPVAAPNTDVDPATNGSSLSFAMPASGSASLVWAAPPSEQTASIFVTTSDGTTVADCQVYVAPGAEPTATTIAPTGAAPTAVATAPASSVEPSVSEIVPTATAAAPVATSPANTESGAGADQPGRPAQLTVAPTVTGQPGDGIAQTGGNPDATSAVRPGDGIPAEGLPTVPGGPVAAGGVTPTMTPRPGDGTGFDGVATEAPTWPVAPTGAPLPAAPPTSVARSTIAATKPAVTRAVTATAPVATATTQRATATQPATATTRPASPTATSAVPTATRVAPTAATTATATANLTPTATALRSASNAATATAVPPTATVTAPAQPTVPPTATAGGLSAAGIPIPTRPPTDPPTATVAAPTVTPQPPTPTVSAPSPTQRPKATATATPDRSGSVAPPTATVSATTSATATSQATATAAMTATATATTPSRSASPSPARSDSPSDGGANPFPNGLPVGVAHPSPTTVAPTSTAAPSPAGVATPMAAQMSQTIPADGGSMTAPGGATLTIDAGTFAAPVTVTIRQLPDSALPVSKRVDLVSGTGYDIGIVDADGNALTSIPGGVSLSLPVPEPQRQRATLYWINGGDLEQVGVSNTNGAGIVSPLTHLSSYVAGVPIDEQPGMGWLPWLIAIAAAFSGLVIVGLLANASRTSGAYRRRRVRS